MVDFDELDFDHDENLNLLNGIPFSGIAYEMKNDGSWDEVTMVNGIENGISREWYPSGILKEEKHIYNNISHGITWGWNEKGQKIREAIYEYGILVKEDKWDENGKPILFYEINEDNSHFENLQIHRKTRRTGFFSIKTVVTSE